VGTLAPGGTATITIHVHATATGKAKNTAKTTANQLDPEAANNKETQKTKIV
jgi:hypothetical protein